MDFIPLLPTLSCATIFPFMPAKCETNVEQIKQSIFVSNLQVKIGTIHLPWYPIMRVNLIIENVNYNYANLCVFKFMEMSIINLNLVRMVTGV